MSDASPSESPESLPESPAEGAESAAGPVFLIDGSGFLFRAFHALPPMTRPDGTPVNAVFGFTNMLLRLLLDEHAPYLAVVFDPKGGSFRNQIYDAYKANRPPPPEELVPQFPLVREAVRAFGLPCLEKEGFEADDLIATLACRAQAEGRDVVIVSSDKDLMQLVGPGITMLDPIKNRPIGPEEVREKFGVGPERVVDVQALAGDSTDNIPGVPGIGVKTAAQLIETYGDLATLLERAGEIKQPKRRQNLLDHAEKARLSLDLVRLRQDAPIEDRIDSFARRRPDQEALRAFLEQNAFRKLISRLQAEGLLGADRGTGGSSAPGEMVAGGGEAAGTVAPGGNAGGTPAALAEAAALAETGVAPAYELVQDLETLQGWIARATKAGVVAVDTETTGLEAMQVALVGVSLGLAAGEACYIPLGHRPAGGLELVEPPRQIPKAEALAALKPLLEDPAVLKVGQNIKFDWLILARQDPAIRMAPLDDTMVLSYVLDGSRHGHGMDELAQLYFNHECVSFSEVVGKGKKQITFDQVPLDQALTYAAEDADITARLHRALKARLVAERQATVYETLDRPLVPVLAQMQFDGVKVDRAQLQELSNSFGHRLRELEEEIHGLAGHSFNVGSPKQLGEVLFDEMGLPGGKKNKAGAWGTASDVLEPLAAQGVEIAAKMLDWRQLAKLKSTYADALVEEIDPQTGRIHTSLSQTVVNTGRLSSNRPNLQNIPIRTEEGRRIRAAFIAEPGHKLLSVDYSQIELRLAAEIAGVAFLKQAFRDGLDIHAMTASQVFGVPLEGLDPALRRKAKAINFGIIYGISGFGLGHQLGIGAQEASSYIRSYLDRLPELKDWLEATKKQIRERGYVETQFGRRIHIRGANDKNPTARQAAERQAINAPIQGSAADIIKRAMIRIPPALAKAGLSARMLLQVHDELLFEVPDAEVADTTAIVSEIMERAPLPATTLDVPLIAEAGVGESWAEAH